MFPLNTVLFPGMSVPLRVFEDRYRSLVEHLLSIEDPVDRVFGTVGIREGYEVGDHGAQSLYRVGVRLRLTEAEARPDGTFDIVAVALDRLALDGLDSSGAFPAGEVHDLPEATASVSPEVVEQARATFTAYTAVLAGLGIDASPGALPRDATYLSWTLAASAPLPMPERQELLEAADPGERLVLVTRLLRQELRAMNVIASLPATEVARTRWSPN